MPDANVLNSKRVVYVGGLADEVTIPLLRACMIPFGPIHSIDMPMDYVKGTSKGFAFIEFEEADDAAEAIFNRNGSHLMGRTLQCNIAQANQAAKLSQPVWQSDDWFQKQQEPEGVSGPTEGDSSAKQEESKS